MPNPQITDLFTVSTDTEGRITLYIKPEYAKNVPTIVLNNVSIRVLTSERRDTIYIETIGKDDMLTIHQPPHRRLSILKWSANEEDLGLAIITISRLDT